MDKVIYQNILIYGFLLFIFPGLGNCVNDFYIKVPIKIVAWKDSCALIPCTYFIGSRYEGSEGYAWYRFPDYDMESKSWKGDVIYNSSNDNVAPSNENYSKYREKNCKTVLRDLKEEHSGNYSVRVWRGNNRWMKKDPFLYLNISDEAPEFKIESEPILRESIEAKLNCSVNYYCPEYKMQLTWEAKVNGTKRVYSENAASTDYINTANIMTFTPSWRDHNKTIQCILTRGDKEVITDVRSIILHVQYAPKDVQILHENPSLTIKEGEQLTLKCTASSSNPNIENFEWFDSANKFLSTGEEINITKAGKYQCKAGNKAGNTPSEYLTIQVLYAPRNVYIEEIIGFIKEGNDYVLKCKADAEPPVTHYIWYKDGNLFKNQTEKTYFIKNIQEHDSGLYACEAHNQEGVSQSKEIKLDVQYPPKYPEVIIEPEMQLFIEGDTTKFRCNVNSSNPQVSKYIWYKNNQLIYKEDKAIINLNPIKPEHSGSYRCKATNSIGSTSSKDISIKVLYPPKKARIEMNFKNSIREGLSVQLKCKAENSEPKISGYKWYKDKILYPKNGPDIKFDGIKWTDSGKYFCEAWNSIGISTSLPADLSVLYVPKNVKASISPSNYVNENTDVMLACTSNANPAVYKHFWYKNNIQLNVYVKNITINNIQMSHDGEYHCVATNEMGTGKSNVIHLHVSYRVSTIIKFAATGSGLFILIVIIVILIVKFKVWNKVYRQRDDQSDTSFFVMKKPNQELPDNTTRTRASAPSSAEELQYSTIQFPVKSEERMVSPRPMVQLEEPCIIYSVVKKPCTSSQVIEYENIKSTNKPNPKQESQEEIHYSTIVNLPNVGTVRRPNNEVEYAMLRH